MLRKVILIAVLCQLSQQRILFKRSLKTPDYGGCGQSNWCFGIPDNCVDSKKCEVLLKTEPLDNNKVQFQLFWMRDSKSTDRYVAAALSEDEMMGDDSTTLLWLDKDSKVNYAEGLTYLKKVNGSEQGGFTQYTVSGIDVQKHIFKDGLLTAKWVREQKTTVNKETFDMSTNKYYVLLARGPVDEEYHIKHHTAKSVSAQAVDLETEPKPVTESSNSTSTQTTTTTPHKSSKQPTSSTTTPKPTSSAAKSTVTTVSTGSPTATKVKPTVTPSGSPTGSTINTTVTGNTTVTENTGMTSNTTATGNTGTTPKPTAPPTTPKSSASTTTLSLVSAAIVSMILLLN